MRRHHILTSPFLYILIIAALGLGSYLNSFYNEFVWDDRHLILANSFIHQSNIFRIFTQDLANTGFSKTLFYRPLQNLSYIIDYNLWNFNPVGYHLTNTFLHIINAILIFFLIKAVTKNEVISLLTSLLFVSHPVHYGVVTYLSGRADSLFTMFFLISFLAFIKHREGSNSKMSFLLISTIGFILSLLCKETSVICVFIFILYDIVFRKGIRSPKQALLPYFLFSIPLVLYSILRLGHFSKLISVTSPGSNFYARLITFPVIIVQYLCSVLVPLNLYMRKDLPLAQSLWEGRVLASLFLVVLIILLGLCRRRKDKIVSFFIFYFFIAVVPVSNIVVRASAPLADHWLYMPSIGYFFVISYCLTMTCNNVFKGRFTPFQINEHIKRIAKKTGVVYKGHKFGTGFIFGMCLVIIYSLITIKQNTYWRDEITLFNEILKYKPNDSFIRGNLALAYMDKGETEKALEEGEKVIKLSPDYARGYYNIATIYYKLGNYKNALKYFKSAIEKDPTLDEPHIYLGLIHEKENEFLDAEREFKKFIDLSPYSALGYVNMGILKYNQGEIDQSHKFFNVAVEKNPGNATAYLYLGTVYRNKGELIKALRLLERAQRIEPNNVGILMDLGNMYNKFGLFDKAIDCFERAVIVSPEKAELYYNIGTTYWLKNDKELAGRYWRRALEINPAFKKAKDSLEELEFGNPKY